MVKRVTFFLALLGLLVVSVYSESIVNLNIGQINHEAPEIKVYFNIVDENDNIIDTYLDENSVSALINGEMLPKGVLTDVTTENTAVHCLFLVDISKSISSAQMETIHEFMTTWNDSRQSEDMVGIVTFGDDINVVQGFTNDTLLIVNAIESIQRTDNTTAFYDGIDKGIQLIRQQESELDGRRIMVVFSDAEDVDAGGVTFDEVMTQLKTANMPVYGVGTVSNPTDSQQVHLDKFAQISRESGGKYYQEANVNYMEIYEDLYDRLNHQYIYSMTLQNNIIDYSDKSLTLVIDHPDFKLEKTKGYINNLSIPDEEAPYVSDWNYNEESKQLDILFSEPVTTISNANILVNGESGMIEINHCDAMHINITLLDTVSGEVNIEFDSIYDISMEENPIDDSDITVTVLEEEMEIVVEEIMPEEVVENKSLNVLFIIIPIILILIAAIVFMIIRKRIKSKELRLVLTYHNEITQENGLFKMNLMDSSILAGRSPECNLFIEDTELSRQHFSIYFHEGNIFLEDMQSSNGTIVDGKKVVEPIVVNEGSRFKAGSTQFVISIDV